MSAPERYAIWVRYAEAQDFVPVGFLHNVMPEGGYFEWDKAVELGARLSHKNPENSYMVTPVVADPI